ncbi:MAG TPA: 3-hydroxyacyl-CoA dehydrogenase NAD-binding domain-containing protein [Aestuariivirgaceae bacterium]|jgi:3-hydroxyacyl-CoA dehydrogenase/enoyl-CoA hydratase/3-hydroxybutyryl-CoA epimerase
MNYFTFDLDAEGNALVTWNMPGRSMNVIDLAVLGEIEEIVARIKSDAAVRAVIITSGKKSFCAGADLLWLKSLAAKFAEAGRRSLDQPALRALIDEASRFSRVFRALETCGKPVVAAITGTALGGGLELCLACHRRIVAEDPSAKLGQPEAKVGLLPGAGGTQRLPRLCGAEASLELMLSGRHIDPATALKLGVVHEIASRENLLARARAWLAEAPKPIQPWDEKGFKIPGGAPYSPQGLMTWPAANALYRKNTYDNYDAQRAILRCVYEGLQVKSFEAALRIEARHFTKLLMGPQAASMIRSLFVSMQDLGKGARRPADVPESRVRTLGILGAGFMGSGIAHVAAAAGIDVLLLDRDLATAEKGKSQVAKALERDLSKGRGSEAEGQAILSRITGVADIAALSRADLVIEAVFENRELKSALLPKAESAMGNGAILASNTSTLPITGLADNLKSPQSFLGIHFFSPVPRMQLVEIIRGRRTSKEAIAKAFDFTRQIRKTPIVVNDSRGFFTSRVVMTHKKEGIHMLEEGVPPAMVENAGRAAGMPVGPLALADEVALDLSWKILEATRADLGDSYRAGPIDRVMEEMVVKRGRYGRKNGKGFYDYPQGGRKRLWPGLAEILPPQSPSAFSFDELKERILLIQALETARCVEEQVLSDMREADVGAILGFGFAPFTGGPLSYIDTMGSRAFADKCRAYAEKYGERYEPPALLLDMARKGETFYERFPPHAS